MNFLPLSFIFSSDLFSIFLISCLGPLLRKHSSLNMGLNFSVSCELIPLSPALPLCCRFRCLLFFFPSQIGFGFKASWGMCVPFSSLPLLLLRPSLHPTLHFLCPSSPKYWLAVMVALCVNCCCWQVCLLNGRKSKEREAEGGGLKAGKYLGWTVCFELYHYLFSSCLFFSRPAITLLYFSPFSPPPLQIRKLCQPRFEKGTWLPRVGSHFSETHS